MKISPRILLCGILAALSLNITASAAGASPSSLPERQGDFYVMVNGEFVTYEDAVPQAKDNRSFLPMAATFTQLGFAQEDMTWNTEGLITASKDDLTIALTLGKPEIVLRKGGKTSTIPTDVAPYVDPATWRTYVPFGLVADALGYNVGWDADTGTVIIDDVDAILAANTASYKLMNRYLDYSQSSYPAFQQIAGAYTLNILEFSEHGNHHLGFNLNGNYELITNGSTESQFMADLAADAGYFVNGSDLLTRAAKDGDSFLTFPRDIDINMYCDLDTGIFSFPSETLRQSLDLPYQTAAWFTLDLPALIDLLDIPEMSFDALMKTLPIPAGAPTFEESIAHLLRSAEPVSIRCTASDMLEELNRLYADDAFEKSGSVYRNNVNASDDSSSSTTLTLYLNGSVINGYNLFINTEDAHLSLSIHKDNMELDMNIRTDTKLFDVENNWSLPGDLYLDFTMTGECSSCTQPPVGQPPSDAVTVDLMKFISEKLTAAGIIIPTLRSGS